MQWQGETQMKHANGQKISFQDHALEECLFTQAHFLHKPAEHSIFKS